MASIRDLPAETISQCIHYLDQRYPINTSKGALISLSETSKYLHEAVASRLWHKVDLDIDLDHLANAAEHCQAFSDTPHPAREYARELCICISQCKTRLPTFIDEEMDLLLSRAIAGLAYLDKVYMEMESSRGKWRKTMQAIANTSNLRDLSFNGTFGVHLPPVIMPYVKRLFIDSEYGLCTFDLSCFPALEELVIGLEDCSNVPNWQNVNFPSSLWVKLKEIKLQGYCSNPGELFDKLRISIEAAPAVPLESATVHLAYTKPELDSLLCVLKKLDLKSLAVTAPMLVDSDFCTKLAKDFPSLRDLELYAYTRAAAWSWPDEQEEYVKAFALLKNLRSLQANSISFGLLGSLVPDEGDDGEPLIGPLMGHRFSSSPTEANLWSMHSFTAGLAKVMPKLQEVGFLPSYDVFSIEPTKEKEETARIIRTRAWWADWK